MYECYSHAARAAMHSAREAAIRSGRKSVLVEHLMLGVLAQPGSVLDACRALGVSPSSIEQAVHRSLSKRNRTRRSPRLPLRKVLEFTEYESRMLEHNAIGTVHLMLAVLRAVPPPLLDALHDIGLFEDEMRKELLRQHPQGAQYPIPLLATLLQPFQFHPEVVALDQKVVSLQQQKEEAIVRQDFDSAARFRDEQDQLKRALIALLTRLQRESKLPPPGE